MIPPQSFRIRTRQHDDQVWIEGLLGERWGGSGVAVHDELFEPKVLPALIADEHAGLVTYRVCDDVAEVVTLDAVVPRQGVGTMLLSSLVEALRQRGCRLLRLTTTNDNLDALRFYQRFGFRLAGIRIGAVARARGLKPTIPLIGRHGIPIRDEIDLQHDLTEQGATVTGTLLA
ncbi:MAG TPA: GNAT family N-acetyltransferase [Acetobacteraceae bacterium]|jgi:GNAT superfamily N-acetyltransferase|nr:GNAT family N-acetyltransferase [Acetobacteraceae bacterium]